LEALDHFDASTWKPLIASDNPNVRHEALRSLSTLQPSLSECFPLLQSLRKETSFYVINELIRFLRDTPHALNQNHLSFAKGFQTPVHELPDTKVSGWRKNYYALGGSYEKRFLNQLIESIGKKREILPAPDEERWSQILEHHPKQNSKISEKLDARIVKLNKLVSSSKGNTSKGKIHFAARCAICHDDKLGGFAPPLGGGAHRDPLEIITAILKPNEAVEGFFQAYKIVKTDGSVLEGFRSDLSHQDITLTFMGGGSIKVPLTDVKSAGYIQGKSVMLANMASGLSDQDFLDLTAYLRSLK
jgi:putative heme-binding domain-containing protein